VGAVQEALFEVEMRPERRFYRQMLDALSRSGFGDDALESERVASRLFGTVWAGQEGPRDGSTEEAFGLGLVDYARHRRVPASVVVLRTTARIAPIREVRDAALSAAAALVSDGLPEPRWRPPLEALIVGVCWAYEDVFGDESTVICEFGYGTDLRTAERHALLVYVDHAIFSVATDAMLTHDVDPLIRDMRNEAKNNGSLFTLRQVDPAWARALLERAFARTDLIEGVRTEPTFAELRALALARLAALPDDPGSLPPEPLPPSRQQRDAVVAEFLASKPAQRLVDQAAVAAVARRIVEHACTYDPGRLLRVSPAKWETFAFDWLPRQTLEPAEVAVLVDVIRAWTEWAGRWMNLPDPARDQLAAAVEEIVADVLHAGPVAR
jgi:hypothetical protein